jgi:hypothetical protein
LRTPGLDGVEHAVVVGELGQVDVRARPPLENRPEHVVLGAVMVVDTVAEVAQVRRDRRGPAPVEDSATGQGGRELGQPVEVAEHGAVREEQFRGFLVHGGHRAARHLRPA